MHKFVGHGVFVKHANRAAVQATYSVSITL